MKRDFAKVIRDNPGCLRALDIRLATMFFLQLRLEVHMAAFRDKIFPYCGTIHCTNAIDYSIRPPSPATIEGGPLVEYHDEHERLRPPSLQMIPGGDGQVFNPPRKFGLLIFDQSYVIAEKFEIEESKTAADGEDFTPV